MKTADHLSNPPPFNHDGQPMAISQGLMKYLLKYPSKIKKMANKKIALFIVDDDILYLKALEFSIKSHFNTLNIRTFRTGEECLNEMKRKPTIVILDYFLNSERPSALNGILILKEIKNISPKTKVIMLSSQDSLNVAIDCMNNGAHDYISKTQTAFVRINKIITNIVDQFEVTSLFFKACEYIVLTVVILMIVYSVLNF